MPTRRHNRPANQPPDVETAKQDLAAMKGVSKKPKVFGSFQQQGFPIWLVYENYQKIFSSIRVDLGVAQEPYFFKKSPNWGQLDRKCFFRTFYFGLFRGPYI